MPYGLKDSELEKMCGVFASNERIGRVVLYGSRAKGNYKPFSDVDITLMGEKLTHSDLNRISLAVDDLLLPYQFDISIFHTLKNEALIDHIHRIGITIYERESEWKEYKLGEICDVRDGTHDSPKENSNGYPLVTSKNIKNGIIDLSNTYLISEADYNFVNQRSKVGQWDVLFSMIGTIGECAIVKEQPNYAIKNVGLFKTNGDKLLAEWIYYYFHSQQAKNEINACLKGSTQQYISLTDLRNFPIEIPTKENQRKILSILTSLDDKIDLLRRENATLEAMAETLFRQWFVEEAKEDWEEGKLGDVCDYVADKIDVTNINQATYVSTENMCSNKQGIIRSSSKPENIKVTKYLVDDVLLSNIRPYFKKIWLSDMNGGCSNDVLCIRSKKDEFKYFTYYTIRQDDFFEYVMLGSKGCKMPRGDKSHIMNWPIMIPSNEVLKKFNSIVIGGIEKIRNNNQQINTLIQTRDELLPRLMSGEITDL